MQVETVVKYSLICIATVVFFWALYQAQEFLIPLSFAAVLAMLMLPVSNKLESWGCSRTWSSFLSTLILVIIALGILLPLSARASRFTSDLPQFQQQISQQYQKWRQTAQERWGILLPEVGELLSGTPPSASRSQALPARPQGNPHDDPSGAAPSNATTATDGDPSGTSNSVGASVAGSILKFIAGTIAFFGGALLVLVYLFTLLLYRDKFQEFLLRLTSVDDDSQVLHTVNDVSKVARKYLWGRLLLIMILAILYAIGFAIAGLQHTIFLAVFAAVLSLIPYIGNVIGITLPVIVALVSPGSMTVLLGVLVVFSVAQFVESYLLEPIIVGSEVDLNPLFTIIAVVAGGILWGVPGLILGIPLLGIARVIFDTIAPLRPLGDLIGGQKESRHSSKVSEKIKSLFGA